MVGYTNKPIFSAVGDADGEIIVRTNIQMNDNSMIYDLKVDTNEWASAPYSNDVATILDYIWTGRGNGWGLQELDNRVSNLESGSSCIGYCSDAGGCSYEQECPYDGECTSDCSSECNWEGCTTWGPGYP